MVPEPTSGFPHTLSLYVPISMIQFLLFDSNYSSGVHLLLVSNLKRNLYISPTHVAHIHIDAVSCRKVVGTNDNLLHNTGKNKDVGYRYLRLCFSLDGGRLQ